MVRQEYGMLGCGKGTRKKGLERKVFKEVWGHKK